MTNEYIPFLSKIKEIVKHTETEYTFRMTYVGDVRPGQFFEVSIPKYGFNIKYRITATKQAHTEKMNCLNDSPKNMLSV